MLKRPRLRDYVTLGVFILVVVGIVSLAIWQWPLVKHIFTTPEELKAYVDSFGHWAPVVFVGFYTIAVVLAVLPANILNFLAGGMFGFWEGLLLSWIASVLGAAIVILLMRRVTLSIMRIFIPNRKLERFSEYVHIHGWIYLFLLYFIPNPLGDMVNYISAASGIQVYKLLVMVAIGRLPTLILRSALGTRIERFGLLHWIVLGVIYIAIIVALYLLRKPINRLTERLSVKLFPRPPHKRPHYP